MAADRNVTLVCGGGGVWGVAWMTGLVMGLAEAGVDVRKASAFVGTSAGSVVSTQLTSSLSTEELFQRQTDPAKQPREPGPSPDAMTALMTLMQRRWDNEQEKLRATCKLALEAKTISPAERRANIVDRLSLPSDAWPTKPLSLTAIDAESLEFCVFNAGSGVPLVDAVAASCAVPGVWPPTPINGRRYVDGGVWRTPDNAHLAKGSRAVLILSPVGGMMPAASGEPTGLMADVAELEKQGATVSVITADQDSLRTMAPGALDPATRKPAAEAGRRQSRSEVQKAAKVIDLA